MDRRRALVLGATLALLVGCASTGTQTPPEPTAVGPADGDVAARPAHDARLAVAWVGTAAEHEALARMAFNAARHRLEPIIAAARADQLRAWTAMPADEHLANDEAQPPAVIFDLDETLIDNAEFHARLVIGGREPDREAWTAWNREGRARAVPGAREFVRWLEQRGVRVYYVSNRPADERAATLRQLEALGFPVDADGGNLLLRDDAAGFGRDKGSRRQVVDRTHRVIALFGDNLADFLGGVLADRATRAARIAPYQSWWGERWFVLPNPMYGSWIEAITAECPRGDAPDGGRACLDAAAGRD